MRASTPAAEKTTIKLRVPAEGQLWLLAAAIFLATGIFKGINLIMLLACLMGVTWLVNFLGVRRRARAVVIVRHIPRTIFAGTPIPVEFDLSQTGKRALFSLRVEDRGPDGAWADYVPVLRSGAKLRLRRMALMKFPGRCVWAPPRVTSGFPFGLVEGVAQPRVGDAIVVLPALGQLQMGRFRAELGFASGSEGRARNRPMAVPAGASEVQGVRYFRSGDSPRWIHWRTTARRGELMVREFEDTPTNNLVVVLDPWVPADGKSPSSIAFRDAISFVASVCWEWCRQRGDHLVLAIANETPLVFLGKTGEGFGIRLLEHLADLAGTHRGSTSALAEKLTSAALPPGPILLVSTRVDSGADALRDRLRRPVWNVNASTLSAREFYARPASHAV